VGPEGQLSVRPGRTVHTVRRGGEGWVNWGRGGRGLSSGKPFRWRYLLMGAKAKLSSVSGEVSRDSGSRFGHGLRKSLGQVGVLRSSHPEMREDCQEV